MAISNDTKTVSKCQLVPVKKQAFSEKIEAITPLFLATIGAVIGIVVLSQPKIDETKATAGMGLAVMSIFGGASIAKKAIKSKPDFAVKQQDANLEVDTPADR